MNLRNIPQVQVNDNLTLGILGTESERGGSTRVQFIMRTKYTMIFEYGFDNESFEVEIGAENLICTDWVGEYKTFTLLFVVDAKSELRNPEGFLRAVARKIRVHEKKHADDFRDYCLDRGFDPDERLCLEDGTPVDSKLSIR